MKDVMHVITLFLLLAKSQKPTMHHMDTGSDKSDGNGIILEICIEMEQKTHCVV
jgi:hypothetical protein